MKLKIALFSLPALVVFILFAGLFNMRLFIWIIDSGPHRVAALRDLDSWQYAFPKCKKIQDDWGYDRCMSSLQGHYLAKVDK